MGDVYQVNNKKGTANENDASIHRICKRSIQPKIYVYQAQKRECHSQMRDIQKQNMATRKYELLYVFLKLHYWRRVRLDL